MKKFIALLLVVILAFSMVGCGNNSSTENESDLSYIQSKGVLVVGITEFEPLDYKDDNGNWIGFDADLATAFAEYLGVEIEFIEIEWGSKILELDSKNIDCVWNGMTLTSEVLSSMECSNAYLSNAQVVVLNADVAADYADVASLASLIFAVEDGSAGEEVLAELGYTYTEVLQQSDALLELSAGAADAAVIDLLMASATVGEGTSYSSLTYTLSLNEEEYGVGFRTGSDLAAALNEFFASAYADGTMAEIAALYGIAGALLEQ